MKSGLLLLAMLSVTLSGCQLEPQYINSQHSQANGVQMEKVQNQLTDAQQVIRNDDQEIALLKQRIQALERQKN